MSPNLPSYAHADPASPDFQYLEDLATGYWYSHALFAAVELRLFDHIEKGPMDTVCLAKAAGCRPDALGRLLETLAHIALVGRSQGRWFNNSLARTHLLSGQPDYMGDFLLYRRYLQPGWDSLARRVAEPGTALPRLAPDDPYVRRNFHYVRAVDRLARLKSREIAAVIADLAWNGPVLDIGAGGGALARVITRQRPDVTAVLVDLPEVLAAARRIYHQAAQWRNLMPLAMDFRFAPPFRPDAAFGLIVMGNLLHTYGPETARQLLHRAVDLLQPGGLVLIHDYFPDVAGQSSPRGGLHDLNMMLNTLDGTCHKAGTVTSWITAMGLHTCVIPLASDSAVIIGSAEPIPAIPRSRIAKIRVR